MYSRVYIEIINVCNKNCSFCPKTVRQPRSMSMDEFKTVIEKLNGITEYVYYHILGEPLMHPLLPAFIKHAKEKGFKSAVTTNGTLLKAHGDELINAGVYKVNISVHSLESTSSHEQYIEYINECLNFADKASKAGVLTVLRLWNKGYDDGLNSDTESMIKDRFGEFETVSTRGARIRHKLHLEYGDRFTWPDINKTELGDSVFCYGLSDHFGILSNGNIVPCCLDREGVITLGNIFDESTDLNSVLNSERAQKMCSGFKKRIATEELCKKCGYARRF